MATIRMLLMPFILMLTACQFPNWEDPLKEEDARLRHLKLQQLCFDAGTQ